jgi:hypothetical protein
MSHKTFMANDWSQCCNFINWHSHHFVSLSVSKTGTISATLVSCTFTETMYSRSGLLNLECGPGKLGKICCPCWQHEIHSVHRTEEWASFITWPVYFAIHHVLLSMFLITGKTYKFFFLYPGNFAILNKFFRSELAILCFVDPASR